MYAIHRFSDYLNMKFFYFLRGHYTCILCCFRLINVKHSKNCFARNRTIEAVVILKTPN